MKKKPKKNKIILLFQNYQEFCESFSERRSYELLAHANKEKFAAISKTPVQSHSNTDGWSVTVFSEIKASVDIEKNRQFKISLLEKVFSEAEIGLARELDVDLTDFWTIKETHIKQYDLNLIDVMSGKDLVFFDGQFRTSVTNKIVMMHTFDKCSVSIMLPDDQTKYEIYSINSKNEFILESIGTFY